MLASNPSANQVPYGTGGLFEKTSEKPPAFHCAVGNKAKNASSYAGKIHISPTNFLGGEPKIQTP